MYDVSRGGRCRNKDSDLKCCQCKFPVKYDLVLLVFCQKHACKTLNSTSSRLQRFGRTHVESTAPIVREITKLLVQACPVAPKSGSLNDAATSPKEPYAVCMQ